MTRNRRFRRDNNLMGMKKAKMPQNTDQTADESKLPPFVILPSGDFCMTNIEVPLGNGAKIEIVRNAFGLTNASLAQFCCEKKI